MVGEANLENSEKGAAKVLGVGVSFSRPLTSSQQKPWVWNFHDGALPARTARNVRVDQSDPGEQKSSTSNSKTTTEEYSSILIEAKKRDSRAL